MTLPQYIRDQVRQRAAYACEFCGISETDTGGQLTIDHFHPRSKGGDDSLDNLLYCCPRCNQYKLDYWPTESGQLRLWDPRREPMAEHFLELDDGRLLPLTEIGEFTQERLRLNRPPLIAHRQRRSRLAEVTQWQSRYQDMAKLLDQMLLEQTKLLEEQRSLLREQLRLLRVLHAGRK